MKCFNCKIEIPQTFGFALSQNRCPACGKEILDEETRALKADIVEYVGGTITLRPETLEKLAMMLISRYDIQGILGGKISIEEIEPVFQGNKVNDKEKIVYDTDEEIRKLKEKRNKEIENKELDELKDEALKEALKDRYNLSFQEPGEVIQENSPTDFSEEDLPKIVRQGMGKQGAINPGSMAAAMGATAGQNDFGDINPILEAARLKKQVDSAQAMSGGKPTAFRRSI